MKLHKLFPTTIGKINDKPFTDKVLPLAENILNNIKKKNHLGYKNTYTSPGISKKLVSKQFIKEKIFTVANNFLDNIGYSFIHEPDLQVFVSKMEKNHSHDLHAHPLSILSGVCYLKIEPKSSPILFQNPNQNKFWNYLQPIPNPNLYTEHFHSINPIEGDILIWESNIGHAVPRNLSNNRTTLVFNIGIKQQNYATNYRNQEK